MFKLACPATRRSNSRNTALLDKRKAETLEFRVGLELRAM